MFSSVGVKHQDRSDRRPGRYLKTSRPGLFEIPFERPSLLLLSVDIS